MKIIDVTKELFSTQQYPGDPSPKMALERTIEKNGYNLTVFSACAHNSTHIDAPCHFIPDGDSITEINIEKCLGKCVIVSDFDSALDKAKNGNSKIILKGFNLTFLQAKELAQYLSLIGTDLLSFGNESETKAVHQILLERKIVLLENLELTNVPCGEYFLVALPLKMKNSDGSPVRAILISNE